MKVVVDANILFAAFIKRSHTMKLMLHDDLQCHVPEYVFQEVLKYKELIFHKSKLTQKEFEEILINMLTRLSIIPQAEYQLFIDKAKKTSPDDKDVSYLALAFKLKAVIWSNDKNLKKQKVIPVFNTAEINEQLENAPQK